jgi:hypothetical protein
MNSRSTEDTSGGLVSLSLADESRQAHFETGVIDVERSAADLWVLRRSSAGDQQLVVSAWRAGTFDDLADLTPPEKEAPIALLNLKGDPCILTQRSVHIFSRERRMWTEVTLTGELRRGVQVAAIPRTASGIYVGINRGEWGGGLQHVDISTGKVTNIERRDSSKLCAGPLNSDCDPVTGVIRDALHQGCVLVGVGLLHFVSHGRVLRVCGEQVTVVAQREYVAPDAKRKSTEAFFGVASAPDGEYWGVTWKALYRFKSDGSLAHAYAFPKVRLVSGVYLSREIPGAIVVLTDLNWAVSVSGYTPLVVPLDEP